MMSSIANGTEEEEERSPKTKKFTRGILPAGFRRRSQGGGGLGGVWELREGGGSLEVGQVEQCRELSQSRCVCLCLFVFVSRSVGACSFLVFSSSCR